MSLCFQNIWNTRHLGWLHRQHDRFSGLIAAFWLDIGVCVYVCSHLQHSFISRARTSRAGSHGPLGGAEPQRWRNEKSLMTAVSRVLPGSPPLRASLPGENSEICSSKPGKPSQVEGVKTALISAVATGATSCSAPPPARRWNPRRASEVLTTPKQTARSGGRQHSQSTICCLNKAFHGVGRQWSGIVFFLLHVSEQIASGCGSTSDSEG